MELNKNNIKKLLGIITFAILLYVGLQHLDLVMNFLSAVFALIFPFVLGGAIAFILNVLMSAIEKRLFQKNRGKRSVLIKLKRPLSLILTLIIVLGIIFFVLFLVIPEIIETIRIISYKSDDFVLRMSKTYESVTRKYPFVTDYISEYKFDWNAIGTSILNFVKDSGGNMLQSTFSVASSILGGVVNFFLGFIFSLYILLQKEKLAQSSKKLLYAYLPEEKADKIISICSLASGTFSRFLSGQCLEAVILGTIFFIAMSIFQMPYALMISVLIGFTALIPVFGAFIGCFIGAFLILIVSPITALWFIIMFVILQQLEGNFIYPHVVGGSVGLPSMWVLVAVTVGGSMMGVAGMLIFIPISSVVYTLLREAMNRRIRERKISQEKFKA